MTPQEREADIRRFIASWDHDRPRYAAIFYAIALLTFIVFVLGLAMWIFWPRGVQ